MLVFLHYWLSKCWYSIIIKSNSHIQMWVFLHYWLSKCWHSIIKKSNSHIQMLGFLHYWLSKCWHSIIIKSNSHIQMRVFLHYWLPKWWIPTIFYNVIHCSNIWIDGFPSFSNIMKNFHHFPTYFTAFPMFCMLYNHHKTS